MAIEETPLVPHVSMSWSLASSKDLRVRVPEFIEFEILPISAAPSKNAVYPPSEFNSIS